MTLLIIGLISYLIFLAVSYKSATLGYQDEKTQKFYKIED